MTDTRTHRAPGRLTELPKAATGIRGFDEITFGGLPRGRSTLITGAAGSGKTLFALEFAVRGAREFGEPAVVLTFEESDRDLAANVASLGFDLDDLVAQGLMACDAFHVDPAEVVTTGPFDLDGLFIRLASAVQSVGAKRVVIDTIEVLFGSLGDEATVRAEFGRLLRWLKDRGLTTVITAERGREGQLTRFGIEEYVSDCVVVLDHRITDEIATRRIRVAKYRGSSHGTNEYPFIITDRGFQVVPLTSMGLDYEAPGDRVSLGVPELDEMLGGGVFRASTVLVGGTAGTGKTTFACKAVEAACVRGERALYVSYEESPAQVMRNMRSVGIDLQPHVDSGLLSMWCERSTAAGLEAHLDKLEQLLERQHPELVVMDAIGSLAHVGSNREVGSIVARHIDRMKAAGITALLTNLTDPGRHGEGTEFAVSSLIDTWVLLRNVEERGERNRLLSVIKSRGTWHSEQVREFLLTSQGPQLLEVQLGVAGVVTGSARLTRMAEQEAQRAAELADVERQRHELGVRKHQIEEQIAALQRQLEDGAAAFEQMARQVQARQHASDTSSTRIQRQRQGSEHRAESESPHRSGT